MPQSPVNFSLRNVINRGAFDTISENAHRFSVDAENLASASFLSYGTSVGIEFDPVKDAANVARHGLSLADFAGFDADPVVIVDNRFDYGEVRYRALGWIDDVPHTIVYTMRGRTMRLISFRRAHAKEMRRHDGS